MHVIKNRFPLKSRTLYGRAIERVGNPYRFQHNEE